MKVIHGFLALLFLLPSISKSLSFMWPKTDDCMSLNSKFLNVICQEFNVNLFVESGTYLGKSCDAALSHFDHIHTIELDENLYKRALRHFAQKPQVHLYHGSSEQIFLSLLPTLHEYKILFWLDGHYSKTAELFNTPYTKSTPIMEELESIRQCNITTAVILIDDLRLFGTDPEYPTLQELRDAIVAISPDYRFIIYGDVGIAFNRHEQVKISKVLRGMTAYFFPDQNKLAWDVLMQQTNSAERTAIKQLVSRFPISSYYVWQQLISK